MSALTKFLERRRPGGDQGIAIVEFALVAPFIILIVFGIIEYGNMWRQAGAIERAAQQGGRTVTAQADNRFADYEALRSIDAVTRGLPGVTVERVIIYRVDPSGDGTVPTSCLGGSVGGLCNRYTTSQIRSTSPVGFPVAGTSTNPTCAGGSWDASWCPTSRPRTETNLVRIGVHVTVRYESVTHLIPGSGVTMERYAVYQIEPCAQGQSTC